MKIACASGLGLVLLAASISQAQETAPPANKPPQYTLSRWDEDYRYLRDPAETDTTRDFFDPIKYIKLNNKGDIYLSLGGQVRYRYEFFNDFNFGAGPQDDDGYHLIRALAHADLHVGDNFRGFLQLKSSMEDNREGGPRTSDADEFDVQQAFVDFRVPLPAVAEKQSVTARFGRQDLIYGAQRLISPLDWSNARRTFEGLKVSYAAPGNTLDAFWVRPVIIDVEEPNDGDGDTSFAGVYDTLALPMVFGDKAGTKLELYGLALNKTKNKSVAVDSDTYTLGSRFSTNPKPWDFDVEGVYQFGDSGPGSISAWSFAVEGGYTFAGVPLTPRPYLGFDIASGDQNPADPDKQTFNQLFPLGHAYFGYIDVIGRQNIIDLHPGAEVTLLQNKSFAQKVSLRGDYHLFWRQSSDDALYGIQGNIQRADTGTDQRFIGSEVDLILNWRVDRHTAAYVGYSHFFAGDFIAETGPNQDIDFVYASVTFTF